MFLLVDTNRVFTHALVTPSAWAVSIIVSSMSTGTSVIHSVSIVFIVIGTHSVSSISSKGSIAIDICSVTFVSISIRVSVHVIATITHASPSMSTEGTTFGTL